MNKQFKISTKIGDKRATSSVYSVVKTLKTRLIVENKKGEKLVLKKVLILFKEVWEVAAKNDDFNSYKVTEV